MSVFTEIIAGNIPGRFAYADDSCAVIATIEPINDGHLLVIPRKQTQTFTELSESEFSHLSQVAMRIGRAQERAFDGTRAMMIIAGLEVPHVHLHVIPARSEADIIFANAMRDVPRERMDGAVEKIRTALCELGYGANVPESMFALK